jgi:hypothetical protein
MKIYSEHEKLKKIKLNNVQDIGEFLQILINFGVLAIPLKAKRNGWDIQKIIHHYYEIDYQKLMDEKQEMLNKLHKKG